MRVELVEEWLGHPPGTTHDLNDYIARQLVERGAAKEVKDKQLKTSSDKMLKGATTK